MPELLDRRRGAHSGASPAQSAQRWLPRCSKAASFSSTRGNGQTRRPQPLLNTDYRLAAWTVASKLGPVLNQVVDPTQTGFLPKRWLEAAATALYSAILPGGGKIARWPGFRLSLQGRAYVAKQLLASMVTFHAIFILGPSQLEESLFTALHTFVAANRPVLGGTSARNSGRDTCFRAVKDGGIASVDLRA
ncbi:g7995 [Coccomyxa elongata]